MSFSSLRARLSAIEPAQWIGAAVALGAVGFIAALFVVEALYGYWKPEPELVYFKSWSADRSYADAAEAQMQEKRVEEEADRIADQLAADALSGLEARALEGDAPAGTSETE